MREQRRQNNSELSISSKDDKDRYLVGMAALFNHKSRLIAEGGEVFFEVIEEGAFDEALQDSELNVIATYNHDKTKMLGRSVSGTLALEITPEGLRYKVKLPNSLLGDEVAELVDRGDLYESSFAFFVDAKNIRWSKPDSNGIRTRFISKIRNLTDVSVVYEGAYSDTKVDISERSRGCEVENNLYYCEKYVEILNLNV